MTFKARLNEKDPEVELLLRENADLNDETPAVGREIEGKCLANIYCLGFLRGAEDCLDGQTIWI